MNTSQATYFRYHGAGRTLDRGSCLTDSPAPTARPPPAPAGCKSHMLRPPAAGVQEACEAGPREVGHVLCVRKDANSHGHLSSGTRGSMHSTQPRALPHGAILPGAARHGGEAKQLGHTSWVQTMHGSRGGMPPSRAPSADGHRACTHKANAAQPAPRATPPASPRGQGSSLGWIGCGGSAER